MDYKIIPYEENLDLANFYQNAKQKGFANNSSKKILIDSISKEREWQVWFLQYKNKIVGSTAAHSFDEMGENSYRILARTCVFTDELPINNVRTKKQIVEHQSVTPQFFMPACIEWVGLQGKPYGGYSLDNKKLYITTNENEEGSQKLVHKIWAPMLAKSGCLEYVKDLNYRNTPQSIWRLNPRVFLSQLYKQRLWRYND